MVSARRPFDPTSAHRIVAYTSGDLRVARRLQLIQELHQVERRANENVCDSHERFRRRQESSDPRMQQLHRELAGCVLHTVASANVRQIGDRLVQNVRCRHRSGSGAEDDFPDHGTKTAFELPIRNSSSLNAQVVARVAVHVGGRWPAGLAPRATAEGLVYRLPRLSPVYEDFSEPAAHANFFESKEFEVPTDSIC